MIVVAYDLVARELILDFGDGGPPVTISALAVCAKFYGNPGRFTCLLGEDVVDVAFMFDENDPGRVVVDHVADCRWRVRMEYLQAKDPGI